MPRPSFGEELVPSLLDRLIDTEPDVSTEPEWQRFQNLRDYELSVLRDVELLLNTRRTTPELPEGCPELAQSVLTYGLPEFSTALVNSQGERETLRRAVEVTIARFEPRLRQVQVEMHAPQTEHDRVMRLTASAVLWVQPKPLHITFDTLIQPAAGTCQVELK